jgi:hypothetical protein
MSKGPHLRKKDKILISGEEYELVENLSRLRGFQFRTWKVKKRKERIRGKNNSPGPKGLERSKGIHFSENQEISREVLCRDDCF